MRGAGHGGRRMRAHLHVELDGVRQGRIVAWLHLVGALLPPRGEPRSARSGRGSATRRARCRRRESRVGAAHCPYHSAGRRASKASAKTRVHLIGRHLTLPSRLLGWPTLATLGTQCHGPGPQLESIRSFALTIAPAAAFASTAGLSALMKVCTPTSTCTHHQGLSSVQLWDLLWTT